MPAGQVGANEFELESGFESVIISYAFSNERTLMKAFDDVNMLANNRR